MQRLQFHTPNTQAKARGDSYARRVLEIAAPYLGRKLLGAGAAIERVGLLTQDYDRLVLVEGNPFSVARLKRQFDRRPGVRVVPGELGNAAHALRWRDERPDTALCVNLLEHLERDSPALSQICDSLEPEGHVVVVVPAGESLFNELDVHEGHYRRYSVEELARKMELAGLDVVHAELFGKLDAIDWALSGYLGVRFSHWRPLAWLKRWRLTAWLFDAILPVPAASLAMIGRKPARAPQRRVA